MDPGRQGRVLTAGAQNPTESRKTPSDQVVQPGRSNICHHPALDTLLGLAAVPGPPRHFELEKAVWPRSGV